MNTSEIILKATNCGFSGQTLKGAARYLVNARKMGKTKYPKPLPFDVTCPPNGRIHGAYGADVTYRIQERTRKSQPELKRAKKDKVFRKAFLRKLNQKIKAMLVPPTSLDEVLVAIDSYSTRNIIFNRYIKEKSELLNKNIALCLLPKLGILVKGFTADLARKHGVKGINMSGKKACLYASHSTYGNHVAGETRWKNGVPVSYNRAIHDNFVRSIGWIVNAQTLDYIFNNTRIQLTLPETYTWQQDMYGLKVVNGPDDYHPEACELLAKDAVNKIIAKLNANIETRRRLALQRLAEIAETENVWVCFNDSIRAGNCRQGTLAFTETQKLNPKKHYSARELLNITPETEISRVRLVIRAAIQRTKIENERGFAILSEHY